jgi:hypothetical protein
LNYRTDVFMAYFDNVDDVDTFPMIAICLRTWRPCTIQRYHESATAIPKKWVVPEENNCSHSYCCIDHWCPFNDTPKDYLETMLSPSEQAWFKENWVNIVDQCKRVYDRDETKRFANLSLNPKTGKYQLSVDRQQ